jgi:hypothetical protein
MTSFMISVRKKGDDGKMAATPRYLVLDDAGAATEISMGAWRRAVLGAFPQTNAQGLPKGDLLFYVHGFNVSFAHSCSGDVDNIAKLKAQGWDGVYASFDWPSLGLVAGYYGDRSNARASANALIDTALAMFVSMQQPACEASVSIMAHSMGAFVVRQAFSWAYQDTKINNKAWSISQLIFVAGDVATGSLSEDQAGGHWLDKYVGRTTCYSNRFDSVLKISDIKNGEPTPRAGRVGLPDDAPASFCNVDCSDLFKSLHFSLGEELDPATPHTFYFDRTEFWQDAVLTLEGGIDREAIPSRIADPTSTIASRFLLETQPMLAADYAAALKLAQLGK